MSVKHILLTTLLGIISITVISCQQSTDKTSPQIQLIIQKEIEVDEQATKYLNKIYPLISASSNKKYIALSNMQHPLSVIQIDYEGNFINRFGSEGRGPGEIQSARFFGFDRQNNITIYDKALGVIKKFDKSRDTVLTFMSPIPSGLDITSRHFNQCNENWYLAINKFKAQPDGPKPVIGIFDKNFKVIKTFGNFDPYLSGHQSVLQQPVVSVDCKKGIAFSTHAKVPFIQVYDLTRFSRITRIDKVPPSFKLSDQFISMVQSTRRMRNFLIDEQSVSTFISHNDDYIFLLFRNETARFYQTRNYTDRNHFLAIYSRKDYSYLGEVPIEGAPMGTTKEGYIITLVNDNPDNFRINLLDVKVEKDFTQ